MPVFGESNLLQALGWAIINSIWQMALLWVVMQLLFIVFPKLNAGQKTKIASLMLFTGFAWFIGTFVSVAASFTSAHETIIISGVVSIENNPGLYNVLSSIMPYASMAYLFLLIIPVTKYIRNYRYVRVVRSVGLSKPSIDWRMFVKRISEQMGIQKTVKLWVSEMISSPVTVGFLKPIILIPVAAINNLSTQQLEAVLLHELAHIRRADYLFNLVITFIRTILYFNPFVLLFSKLIEREREKSCDEIVLQFQYDRMGYASALLQMEKARYIHPMLLGAAGKKNDLVHRIEKILGIEKRSVISVRSFAGFAAGLFCVIALNALLILGKPVVQNGKLSFQQLANPFYFFTNDENAAVEENEVIYTTARKDVQKDKIVSAAPSKNIAFNAIQDAAEFQFPTDPAFAASLATYASVINSGLEPQETLKKYQEAKVYQALEMTRKVLEEKEWKKIETQIADALTDIEKEEFKAMYLQEIDKINWKEVEQDLKSSYNKLNWDNIGEQLNTAMTEIRIDSLHKVYSVAAKQLNQLEKELALQAAACEENSAALTLIHDAKIKTTNALQKIKAAKTKKVVTL